jgi:hypothetical protein
VVWRTGESRGASKIDEAIPELKEHWAMLESEARQRAKTHPNPACICLLLRRNSEGVAILYVDADEAGAFGDDERVKAVIKALSDSKEIASLAQLVGDAVSPLQKLGPFIKIDEHV